MTDSKVGGSVLVIAEAGISHNGDLDTAYRLVDVAQEAGADCCKFQTFFDVPKYNHLRLSRDEWARLKEYCDNVGIEFMSTPEGILEIDFLAKLGMKRWKVGSDNIRNYPFLGKLGRIASQTGDVFLSTGKAKHIGEIERAQCEIGYLEMGRLFLLHCVSEYPANPEKMCLYKMRQVRSDFFGLSDHTISVEAIPAAAVALGASVIEKHFTLDRSQTGGDHHMSLEPDELKRMVRAIRDVELAMGDGIKRIMPCEREATP